MTADPAMPAIMPFQTGDEEAVIALIVPIQAVEFGIPISTEDQPDLRDIPNFYQSGSGGFWVAKEGDRIVGTIALRDFGESRGALRKMFVAADRRGREHGVAASLLATLLDHARRAGLISITLGTIEAFVAAHRFYERNGFARIAKPELPAGFPAMPLDNRFYTLEL